MPNPDRKAPPLFRRPKTDPCADFWHTMRWGLPMALVLALILPVIFRAVMP